MFMKTGEFNKLIKFAKQIIQNIGKKQPKKEKSVLAQFNNVSFYKT